MKRNQPKVEQVEMNEIATKASRVAESRTACLIDESLRIARNNNQDPFRTLAVSAYLQGVQDALTPPSREWRSIDTVPPNGEFLALWPALKLDDDGNITDKPAGHPPFRGVAYSTNGAIEGPDALNATGDYFGDDWEYGAATHWMPLPPDPTDKESLTVHPSAEPSGNTGELPVCATCGGTGVICDIHGRDDIYQEDDSYEQRCMICVGDERSGELVACPDCSASGSLPDQEGKKREK